MTLGLILNTERSLRYLVPKWLITNAKYQSSTMTKKEANDLYNVYKEQVDFHSPDMDRRTFKVSIGKPKIRGRKYMTLPHMSLSFNTLESAVNIYSDIWSYLPEWCKGMIPLMGLSGHLQNLLQSNFAVHPHISSNGSPCLGDYGNGWCQAVVGGNIPMLVNVARSYVNNWTRNDAYWNINQYNQHWEKHKIVPFDQYLIAVFFWYDITNRRDRTPNIHHTNLNRLLTINGDTGIELYSSLIGMGYQPLEIIHWWFCVNHLTSSHRDDSNNIVNLCERATGSLQRLSNEVTDVIDLETAGMVPGMKTNGLINRVLIRDFDAKLIPDRRCNLWNSPDNTLNESIESFIYVCHSIRDTGGQRRNQPSRYNFPTAVDLLEMKSQMAEFGRRLNAKYRNGIRRPVSRYLRKVMIPTEDVCDRFGRWWIGNYLGGKVDQRRNAWLPSAVHILSKLDKKYKNYDRIVAKMVMIWAEEAEDGYTKIGKYIYDIVMDFEKYRDMYRNEQFLSQLNHELVSETLDLISLTLKVVYGDVNDSKHKARKRAFGDNTNRDGGENQLSLETF